jgi:hypothetical protein
LDGTESARLILFHDAGFVNYRALPAKRYDTQAECVRKSGLSAMEEEQQTIYRRQRAIALAFGWLG